GECASQPCRPKSRRHDLIKRPHCHLTGESIGMRQRRLFFAAFFALECGMNPGMVAAADEAAKLADKPPLSPVQMFVPGFSVSQLPIPLNNINNVRYRRDGKLMATGYDGKIWLLSDTDGDGLEDHAEPYWDKPTLRVPLGIA